MQLRVGEVALCVAIWRLPASAVLATDSTAREPRTPDAK